MGMIEHSTSQLVQVSDTLNDNILGGPIELENERVSSCFF